MIDLTWTQSYETGHPGVDLEHRVFVDLLTTLGVEAEQGASSERLQRLVVAIYKYADFHFFSEESLMLEVGYPDYNHHRQLHQALLAELLPFVESVSLGLADIESVLECLKTWFVGHTLYEDLKLARYVDTNR